ncbi:glycosyl hydrolase family 32 [Opitutaceae bacterium TAV5]|nr:glycosyl hydrolase family 32 [Opitutaceae bacterium TAV5]
MDTNPPASWLPSPVTENADVASREIALTEPMLLFPIRNNAPKRIVYIAVDGQIDRIVEVEFADGQPEWWAPLDVRSWRGQTITLSMPAQPGGAEALGKITQGTTFPGADTLYREPLRGQFHFSPMHGWMNDPNGLSYYNGEYHLFFQHSPYGWTFARQHWGHAVSTDLVHWQEGGPALVPDRKGQVYSGSAVVDRHNTSGLGTPEKPPLVLIYTLTDSWTQCLAWSTDGRIFKKVDGCAVERISDGNRDPKVLWHEPTRRWVMVLYVEQPGPVYTVHFLTSPNLRDWTPASVIIGGGKAHRRYLYECPDFYELPVENPDAGHATADRDPERKWVLSGANSEYQVGIFDGTTFIPETRVLAGQYGRAYYAAQTFSDEPHGRRIEMGWWNTPTPGMHFNQSMSLPMELRLVRTPDGPRLARTPVRELEVLRAKSHHLGAFFLEEDAPNPLAGVTAGLVELSAEIDPGTAREIVFFVRNGVISYDVGRQQLRVQDLRAPAPLLAGRLRLTIFADRIGLEVFASDGLTFVPLPLILDPNVRTLSLEARGGRAEVRRLDVHRLRNAWGRGRGHDEGE